MPGFTPQTYDNLVNEPSETQKRVFMQFGDAHLDYDVIVVGSGMGGGILADDLADNFGQNKRVLVLEAGSYLFPTHVYNLCRFHNYEVAKKFAVRTFAQTTNDGDEYFIGERPQLNFGGRSIFWSGLIPKLQQWELDFFPPSTREGIRSRLDDAGKKLNASVSMGKKARDVVSALRETSLADHFEIQETPRALHQPYLTADGSPGDEFWIESTGVFNTAELLVNQAGLNPGNENTAANQNLHLLLNHYVESVERLATGRYRLDVTDTLANQSKVFTAKALVLAAGSIESPKIIRRSPVFTALPAAAQTLVGKGITDHPTTNAVQGPITNLGGIVLPRNCHAKIIFYSRGRRGQDGSILYPFNVEMNINHEYWHLRENDPTMPQTGIGVMGDSILDIKFSFGNFIDDANEIQLATSPATHYVPGVRFKNLKRADYLANNRFKALAGWNKSLPDIWWVLNDITNQIFSKFQKDGTQGRPDSWYGESGNGFGYGTVHHAVGTLRMPAKGRFDAEGFSADSVVDENLAVVGHPNMFVCDMSVMPYSASANPVRTLAALALRLSQHLRGV